MPRAPHAAGALRGPRQQAIIFTTLACCLGATTAQAGGIERTTQSVLPLYDEGNKVSLSFGYASPQVSGTSYAIGPFPAAGISNVAGDFGITGLALKYDLTDQLSMALIYEEPFGADVAYDPANPALGGTTATSTTQSLTALAKYSFTERVSAFGGLRLQRSSGNVTLSGAAYGPLSGYNVELADDTALGYVLGGAYEIPEIALRVALTYNSAIEHDFATSENINPGVTTTTQTKTPSSWNLEFQTGVAEDTLLLGSVRYVKHSEFKIEPVAFFGAANRGLVNLEDTVTYRIGVGRRFNDAFSGSLVVGYEAPGKALVSPLAPSTGRTSITLGGAYKLTEQVELSGGLSHTWLGDANPQTSDTARADFSGNSVTALGLKISYAF